MVRHERLHSGGSRVSGYTAGGCACATGAVASIVIELKGLQLKLKNNGEGYDTTTPAAQVLQTIQSLYDDGGNLHESIHDVVCSKQNESHGQYGTLTKAIFYARFAAPQGRIVFNIWGQGAALGLEELPLDKLDGTDHLKQLKGLGKMPYLESQVNLWNFES